MGVDFRLMRHFIFPMLFASLIFMVLAGCTDEDIPIRYIPDAEPLSDPSLPLAPELNDDRQYDELGRLREAKEKVYQYQIPRGAWLRRASAGLREYELVCSEQALTEFYTHRKYPVLRKGAGYKVLPAPSHEAEEVAKNDKVSRVTLHITRTARNRFKLRFFRARPQNYVPEVNQEFLHERSDLSAEEKERLTQRLQQERGQTKQDLEEEESEKKDEKTSPKFTPHRNGRTKVQNRFNPEIKRGTGQQNIQPRIKQWLQNKPGAVFYD
jgi:hypothetical protein